MLTIYIAAALFGGCVLVGSWFLGHDHPTEAAVDHDDGAEESPHAGPLGTLLKLRFWTFGLTFFGLSGLILHLLGSEGLRRLAPFLAGLFGAVAGFTAARLLGRLLASAPGALGDANSHVGREGRLLLPVGPGLRGKVRLEMSNGASLDLVAETQEEGSNKEALPLGTRVMVLELRDSVALVARSPIEKGKP